MQPNIIYIHSHDTGRLIQPYGYAAPTPNLQQLAQEGMTFRRAFCAAPTCSPSRAALLTGQCAHSSGMLGLAHRGFALHDTGQHLLHTLRAQGYHNVLAGLQHVAADAKTIGFDEICAPEQRTAAHVAPAAVDFLSQAPSEPFFLDVGFFETHREFPAPSSTAANYVRPPRPLPDAPATRYDMAAYNASVRDLDDGVGAVLSALAASGLAERTLVIYTTDHGPAFPAMKCNLTDHGTGVSLILRGPGGFHGGKVCDAMLSQIDIFPTLCDFLGMDPPAWVQGRSFLPVIDGRRDEINDAVFAEVTYHAAYEPMRAVRTHRYKYIRRYGDRRLPVLPNCDEGPSKEYWLAHGWEQRAQPIEQLYDLVFDPHETYNLAAQIDGTPKPAQAATGDMSPLETLRSRLESWMHATGDPLLAGPVPAPAGAKVNDPAGRSPRDPAQTVA